MSPHPADLAASRHTRKHDQPGEDVSVHTADRATSAPPADELHRLLTGEHHDPHSVLGAHPRPEGTAVRV
ncbi:MAG: GlgB N-terminal domain-containing protein, partial [Pseudonocardiaceae bacterium]